MDHGTAFDIAGKAIADSRSMVEALHQAAEMAARPSVAVRRWRWAGTRRRICGSAPARRLSRSTPSPAGRHR
nr:4-hydroxythreonine-4-phosphate dehydrogenase PdxA [Arthrobacter sp. FB24]